VTTRLQLTLPWGMLTCYAVWKCQQPINYNDSVSHTGHYFDCLHSFQPLVVCNNNQAQTLFVKILQGGNPADSMKIHHDCYLRFSTVPKMSFFATQTGKLSCTRRNKPKRSALWSKTRVFFSGSQNWPMPLFHIRTSVQNRMQLLVNITPTRDH